MSPHSSFYRYDLSVDPFGLRIGDPMRTVGHHGIDALLQTPRWFFHRRHLGTNDSLISISEVALCRTKLALIRKERTYPLKAMKLTLNHFLGCMVGLATGDALGVPHEVGPIERLVWKLIGKTANGHLHWHHDLRQVIGGVVAMDLEHHRRDTFERMKQFAIDCRGDVDTIGAMAAALWGASRGASELLPTRSNPATRSFKSAPNSSSDTKEPACHERDDR
jgi:hypothetical protein